HDELAAVPDAVAARLGHAAMQLDDTSHEREADAEPALAAYGLGADLREQIEDRLEMVGIDAAARVADANLNVRPALPDLQRDAPAARRELRRVVQQVHDHLR